MFSNILAKCSTSNIHPTASLFAAASPQGPPGFAAALEAHAAFARGLPATPALVTNGRAFRLMGESGHGTSDSPDTNTGHKQNHTFAKSRELWPRFSWLEMRHKSWPKPMPEPSLYLQMLPPTEWLRSISFISKKATLLYLGGVSVALWYSPSTATIMPSWRTSSSSITPFCALPTFRPLKRSVFFLPLNVESVTNTPCRGE